MRDIFIFLLINMVKHGHLNKATFFGEDFATIEIENNGKLYSINVHCDEIKEEENDA